MNLSVGIVGLPNAGKSTLFNALAARRLAPTAAHPFTTIAPHEAVVPVPDENLSKLADLVKPEKITPATVTFVDIAGLVRGAHKGEGLGNQFLAKIREVDAIVHVVRGFEDLNVPHVHDRIDPKEDIEVVNLELELGGIKGKPSLYVLNVNDSGANDSFLLSYINILKQRYSVVVINAKLEEELNDEEMGRMEAKERAEFRKELGVEESGIEKLINEAYKLLGLITFYTLKGGREVRAWSLKEGSTALEAAGRVHSDFTRNFIKAEVVGVDELFKAGGWHKAKEQGKIRLEGREYRVQDGDVVEFKVGI